MNIRTDSRPGETSWELTDAESGVTLLEESAYTASNKEYEHQACIPSSICITFTIYDYYYNGITGSDAYKVSVNDEVVTDKYGTAWFGYYESLEIWDGCIYSSPTITPRTSKPLSQKTIN